MTDSAHRATAPAKIQVSSPFSVPRRWWLGPWLGPSHLRVLRSILLFSVSKLYTWSGKRWSSHFTLQLALMLHMFLENLVALMNKLWRLFPKRKPVVSNLWENFLCLWCLQSEEPQLLRDTMMVILSSVPEHSGAPVAHEIGVSLWAADNCIVIGQPSGREKARF